MFCILVKIPAIQYRLSYLLILPPPLSRFHALQPVRTLRLQVKRLVPNPTVKKDFRGHLAGQEGEARQVASLIDLLEKMMHLDPDKRITAKEALRHSFIKEGRGVQR